VHRRGRRVVLPFVAAAALALVLAPVLAGCGTPPSDVGVVGDSITVQLEPYLDSATNRYLDLSVAAVSGATIGDMVDDAARVAASRPPALIVNLGSNDVVRNVPPEQSVADLERLLDQFEGVRCLVLVTVNENMFSYDEGYLTERAAITNAALAGVAARRGAVVIDWNDILTTQRQTPGTPDMLLDTVHVTVYGAQVLSAAYLDAVERNCSGV